MRKSIIALTMAILIVMLPVCFADTLSLQFDPAGNLITGDLLFRQYNSLNQLHRVYNGSDANGILLQEYTYHPVEERVLMKKTYNLSGDWTETVIYVNKNFVRTINESGTFDSTYVYHEGQLIAERRPDDSRVYYHPDMLGSTSLITDNGGSLVEQTFYSAYGVILDGGDTSRYDFTGHEFDDTLDDYDANARRYKAEWGKFSSADGIISQAYNPQNLNRYSYAFNNPYKYTDPTGHEVRVETEAGGQIVYIDDGRFGRIVDGSERVRTITIQPFTASDGTYIGGGSFDMYDYDVEVDNRMMTNYGQEYSLNQLTLDNSKDWTRKENLQKANYLAQPIVSTAGKIYKGFGVFVDVLGGSSAGYNAYQDNWGKAAYDVTNMFPPTSFFVNVIAVITFESAGREIGNSHSSDSGFSYSSWKSTKRGKTAFDTYVSTTMANLRSRGWSPGGS